ncbi:hypothetical protein CIB84_014439 [Bambusicola thoracicus]|uniref:Uncharacterized protein n=1 Tax=Bambusicola thoracicus TaxID=9083 RepID=A0A2P4SCG1_BAMTH|nr:hypothetical protein CIB84_014439 [Bambusicola thoracicus]
MGRWKSGSESNPIARGDGEPPHAALPPRSGHLLRGDTCRDLRAAGGGSAHRLPPTLPRLAAPRPHLIDLLQPPVLGGAPQTPSARPPRSRHRAEPPRPPPPSLSRGGPG